MKLPVFLIAAVAALTACGGGGGGGSPAASEPRLQSVAALSYLESGSNAGITFDPWTSIRLEPTVTGLPATTARSFQLISPLPAGLAFDPSTGVVSGLAESTTAFALPLNITMTATGYSSFVSATTADFRFNGLAENESVGGGFNYMSAGTATNVIGTVGVAGTITAKPSMVTWLPGGGQETGGALPAGATTAFGLTARSTVPGGSMNPATGVYQWTPDRTGSFVVEWYADITYKGVTRRVVAKRGSGLPTLVIN